MDLTKAFEDKLWSSMSSFDLGYVPSMALVMANHQLDGTNYGAERPQNYYQWLPRRFKSWHLHRDIHLCLKGEVVLTSVPPIIYKKWSQTRFKMGKMPLGMKVVLSNLPFINYLKLKFPKFIINKLQV